MTDLDLDIDATPDPNTDDMFGAPPAAQPAPSAGPAAAYQVLARKYRPRTFEDLIGQEAMVRTLSNAFAADRIAHAFMLTGVRGVGKTTTARLLARALNFESDSVHRPTVDLTVDGRHCASIIEGRHMDVLELDAATRTKVDDMRELLDGVRYAPVEARYKVYIIDEVHMLSTAAFNALLKTLEEPPPHAKFIFATTEIRKVPVTILSRCQRFDLRRVEPEVLVKHLEKIAAREGAVVEADGLALIARAAEGSVRDGLSLLDQAIVQTDRGQPVAGEVVRDMLGLADRSQTIALFESVMTGKAAEALAGYRTLYGFGADPAQVVGDLLEHAHAASVGKTLGREALSLPNAQAQRLTALGAQASAAGLARMWQMLLKAYDEVRRAPDPSAAVEMALIRLCYAASLPGPEEALKALQSGASIPGAPSPSSSSPLPPPGPSASGGAGPLRAVAGGPAIAQAGVRPLPQAAQRTVLQTFDDVLQLIDAKRDVTLKLDVERYVRLVDFKPGVIAFEPAPGAPANLPQRLSGKLKEWTGQPWMMDIQTGGQETGYERDRRQEADVRAAIEADPFVTAVRDAFPGAEIIGIRPIAAPEAAAVADDGASGDEADDD
jgi:DNA polymerase-3 subunit gamma/tau